MTEPEKFLQRWSKRKLAKDEPAPPEGEPAAQSLDKHEKAAAPTQDVASVLGTEEKPFDPASLPSIESIDASTDVTGFLRPGVPPELTRAALRRAWSTDPAIRDFVGLVENGWDFNDPQAMPGFGPITPSEVARLAAQMFGDVPAAKPESKLESKPESKPEAAVETAKNPALQDGGRDTAASPVSADNSPAEGQGEVVEPPDVPHSAPIGAAQKKSEG